jgi:TetR/AcrR family transcriptional repressor of bet genes
MNQKRGGTNQTIQTERRRLLIDATVSAISTHGLSGLTLAKIAEIAGLSAGSVNFHFTSKEALLLETLTFLAEELESGIDHALAAAGGNAADQLLALMEASLDPGITDPRKMAVWFAFTAEARGRVDYQRICGAQDRKIFTITHQLCDGIIRQGGRQQQMSSRAMANAVQGLVDELWQEILYKGDQYDRKDARHLYLSFLASVFPWAYQLPKRASERGDPLSTADATLHVERAKSKHAKEVARLFDLYRQFYDQPADPARARKFIGDNIRGERSTIFVAQNSEGETLGFVQLYPGWCSVAAAPFFTLYDLYVESGARQRGVGRALMEAAAGMARKTRACRIDLETAIDNHAAQALYEDLGYQRDTEFYKYSLALP